MESIRCIVVFVESPFMNCSCIVSNLRKFSHNFPRVERERVIECAKIQGIHHLSRSHQRSIQFICIKFGETSRSSYASNTRFVFGMVRIRRHELRIRMEFACQGLWRRWCESESEEQSEWKYREWVNLDRKNERKKCPQEWWQPCFWWEPARSVPFPKKKDFWLA